MTAATAPTPSPLNFRLPSQLNRTNVAIGVVISLLLHFGFVLWSLHHKMDVAREVPDQRPIEIRLISPPVPVPAEPPPPVAQTRDENKPAKHLAETKVKPVAPTAAIITSINKIPAPDAAPVTPTPAAPEKHIDMGAMQANIRTALAQVDREKADTPSGQLVAKPLYPPEEETKMGKMINGTTRADCKDQVGGAGLFTPVLAALTLLDKKDSGCKWR